MQAGPTGPRLFFCRGACRRPPFPEYANKKGGRRSTGLEATHKDRLFFSGGGILRFFRFVVLQVLDQGLDTMLYINEGGADMDLVQIGKEISYFFEEAHNLT